MTSVSTQTDVSAGFFVIVSGAKNAASKEKYELPLNPDGNLKLETLRLTFPGVSAVQYKNPESGIMRILKEEKGLITPPPEGWGKTEFSICQPQELVCCLASDDESSNFVTVISALKCELLDFGQFKDQDIGTESSQNFLENTDKHNKRPATDTPPALAPPSKINRPLLSTPGSGPPPGQPPALMDLNGGGPAQGSFGGMPPIMNGNNSSFNGNGPMMDFQSDEFGMQGPQFTVNGQGMEVGAPGGPKAPYPLQCDLCKVQMNGQNQAQLHFEGRRHKEAVLHTQGEPELPYGGMMGPTGPPPMMMNDMMPPMMGPGGGPGMMGPPMMGADPYYGGGEYYDNQMMFNAGPPSGPPQRGGARGRSFINARRGSGGRGSSGGGRGSSGGGRGSGNFGGRGAVPRGGRSGFGVRGSSAKRARGKNGSFQNDDLSGFKQF